MKTIIFVCHGNICRSIAAECIASQYLQENNLNNEYNVISRATSLEEIGNSIYPPMRRELIKRKIAILPHIAEQISQKDYELADYIFYMDSNNKRYLDSLLNDYKNIIKPIFYFTNSITGIEDPWYTDRYEKVVDELIICINDIFKNLN